MSTLLNKYHPVLIHVYSTMITELAIILILRNATVKYTHQTHEKIYNYLQKYPYQYLYCNLNARTTTSIIQY